ncbi:sigma-70 family RNA polymerase sigma factor [Rhizobium sp. L1K21]|uniref:sigma-70 family RNA polymerase sigma factor n=1 Tax=Rhizobium sp. L1K21 TaxID=2954933 RepID=UPI002093F421|nr:sigma-70 family RNA polymerase sigma factor [Rhizobium sp. L1K21]MCO6184667.1 sigma-70 family RNA polymerase sigma factor [Rhizobium sp. L1K21]
MADASHDSFDFKKQLLSALPSLRAFAVSLCGQHDRADDLVQETVMKAWSKQESFELGTNIKAWLFTILRNEFYSQLRKRGREVADTDEVYSSKLSVHPNQLGQMDMQDFLAALAQIPDDQREAIVLVCASGFSYEEAAEICDCKIGTIKSRINRARNRLQELLDVDNVLEFGPDSTSAAVIKQSFAS